MRVEHNVVTNVYTKPGEEAIPYEQRFNAPHDNIILNNNTQDQSVKDNAGPEKLIVHTSDNPRIAVPAPGLKNASNQAESSAATGVYSISGRLIKGSSVDMKNAQSGRAVLIGDRHEGIVHLNNGNRDGRIRIGRAK
jgi:hypothetical protein